MVAINPEYIAFFGVFIGVLVRIYLPYIRKVYQGTVETFDNKYIISGLVGLVFALITTFLLGPEILIVPTDTMTSLLKVFWLNWITGFGASSVVNELLAWGAPTKEA